MQKRNLYAGAAAVVIAALLWSLDGTFLRPQLYSLPSTVVVFLEHLLGFVVLAPFLFIHRRAIKSIPKKTWVAVFWVALFGGALGTTFITKALFLTGFQDISVVILLQKFQPIFAIVLAAIFLRERFPRRFYLYAGVAVIAGYFVTFKDPFTVKNLATTTSQVALFALLAAFAWGSSTTFGKYSVKNIHFGLLAALRFTLTVVIMAIPAWLVFRKGGVEVAPMQWGTLAIIVVTSGALAMFLYYYGLKKITASLATLCELAWPVSAVVLDYFVNGNSLSWSQLTGAAVLISAVLMVTRLHRSWMITGRVQKGNQQAESMGARTANLDIALAGALPRGLYTCEVVVQGSPYQGLLYYGHNSLTGSDTLEVTMHGFDRPIYGETISVATERYLRLPKKFSSPSDLRAQIEKDLKIWHEEKL